MALERGIPDFLTWFFGDLSKTSLLVPTTWGFLFGTLAICLLLLLVVPFICFVILSLQYGPSEAFYYVARSIFSAVTGGLAAVFFTANVCGGEARRARGDSQ